MPPKASAAEVIEGEIVQAPANFQIDPITAAEIDVAVSTAHRFPRVLGVSLDVLKSMVTVNRETAESVFYSLRRDGKAIRGRSVRFTEIVAAAWGNVRSGSRILGESADGRFVRALGFAHDLQTNNRAEVEVTRRITTKEGRRYSEDMIGVTAMAASAIARRNAMGIVVPEALTEEAYNAALAVAIGDVKTLNERREAAIARFAKLNPLITPERILAALDRKSVSEITLDDLTHLIGLHNAIRDGEQSIDQAFPAPVADKLASPAGSKLDAVAQAAVATAQAVEAGASSYVSKDRFAELLKIGKSVGIEANEIVFMLTRELGIDELDFDAVPEAMDLKIREFIKKNAVPAKTHKAQPQGGTR
jgi:hypothetical protein